MNEARKCVICQQATDHMACITCQRRIRNNLADIQTYAALAANELIPGRGGDGRSTERGLGIRLDALDLVAGFDVLPVLELWERDWRETYHLAPYGPASAERNAGQASEATLTSVLRFLGQWLDRACTDHPAIDDFHDEVRTCWHQARQAANAQPRQAWRVTCPTDQGDSECGNPLRVTGQDFGNTINCRQCQTTWPTERLLMVVASSQRAELWLDPEAASEWVGVNPRTLRKWASQGKIKREHGRYEVHSLRNALQHGVAI